MIRTAKTGELLQIWALYGRVVAEMRREGISQWDERYPTPAIIEEDIRQGLLYCRDCGGAPGGAFTLNTAEDPEYETLAWGSPGPYLVVHRLCVDPSLRGRGIARELMAFAETEARRKEFSSIRLDTFEGNPGALSFYNALGYRRLGTVRFAGNDRGNYVCFEKIL